MSSLAHSVAIVTAGAAGIGQSTVLKLVDRGYAVVAADVDEIGLTETRRLASNKEHLQIIKSDVTTESGAKEIVQFAKSKFGGVHALANVVGGSRPGLTTPEIDLDDWEHWVNLNLTSAFLMCRAAIPEMESAGRGVIINVSSGAGVTGMAKNPAYVAAKGGLIAFTKALAIDHSSRGIRCNAIAPGPIMTPLMRRNRSEQEIEFLAGITLTGRVGEPADIASTIAFLVSDDASFINGELINVTGGIRGPV
ncbi:SDR family NAD(P)-dependent oxidoreductase [Hyphococcus sp. DH-69]|uniref:SDR family NAD(P)-dependent oxidoreductase n=1 Tax=Hyphococcus formosus TaxID=3143534 RepID=UPI00398AD594